MKGVQEKKSIIGVRGIKICPLWSQSSITSKPPDARQWSLGRNLHQW